MEPGKRARPGARMSVVASGARKLRTAGSAGARSVREFPSKLRGDRVLLALTVLLAIGAGLRLWMTLVWSPAITGYSDSGVYFQDAVGSIWADPIRTQGYSMILHLLHAISPHLILVPVAQHILGLASALLLFAVVGRAGAPRWLGLVGAAMIALGGDQIVIEHAALSDAVFVFLFMATLYCAVRSIDGGLRWLLLLGLVAGLNVWERGDALLMLGVVPLWLALRAGRPTRRTLGSALLVLAVAVGVIGVYVGWRKAASTMPGLLTSNNSWNLYGRVAPWADCRDFTPPAGTGALCDLTPAAKRGYPSSEDYIYNIDSPAWRLFGPPYEISPYPHAMELMQNWSLAAIEGEPLEYLRAVGLDVVRLFDPKSKAYGDDPPEEMIGFMLYGHEWASCDHSRPAASCTNEFVEYWQAKLYPGDGAPHRGDIEPLHIWEEMTRVDGVWMAILLALCLAGPWLVPRGRARSVFGLLAFASIATLLFPIFVKAYDYRFMIPAFGPLMAAAGLSAWGLAGKLRARRRRDSLRRPAPEPGP